MLKRTFKDADTKSHGQNQMMKRILILLLACIVASGIALPPEPVWAFSGRAGLPISAGSALLFDLGTQKVIYAKAPHSRRPPASTTKLMTALVILERVPLERVVRIPGWVKSVEPSKVYLKPGERYRVRDLLHASLISSANDASEVLAVSSAGSRAEFAKWMNAKARSIGCRDTRFTNASGLPLGSQYSTVYDLALIMKEAQRNPFIVDSMLRRYHTIYSSSGRRIFLKNHNRLLWKTQSHVIGKTGWTRKGRACFVGRIQWQGREVLVSLLGSHRLWQDLGVLLSYQFGAALFKIQQNRGKWPAVQTARIQAALRRAGYSPGPVDGRFGPKTVKAVQKFQKSQRLRSDGIVGPVTCRALTRYGLPKEYCKS